MKKHCVFLMVLITICILCGCNVSENNSSHYAEENEKMACYLLSCSNDLSDMNATDISTATESQWWNGSSFKSPSAVQNVSIEFCGETYTGTYRYSRYDNYNSFATDYYDGDDGLVFGINAADGSIVYLNLKTLSFFEKEPFLADSADAAKETSKIAQDIASLFVDLEAYDMLDPTITPYQPEEEILMSFFTYTFVQKINGENSSAYLSVQVTSKGNLASVVVGDINAFSAERLVDTERFSSVSVDELIGAQTKDILQRTSESSPEIVIDKMYYALTPEGDIVICARATGTYSTYSTYGLTSEASVEMSSVISFEFVVK